MSNCSTNDFIFLKSSHCAFIYSADNGQFSNSKQGPFPVASVISADENIEANPSIVSANDNGLSMCIRFDPVNDDIPPEDYTNYCARRGVCIEYYKEEDLLSLGDQVCRVKDVANYPQTCVEFYDIGNCASSNYLRTEGERQIANECHTCGRFDDQAQYPGDNSLVRSSWMQSCVSFSQDRCYRHSTENCQVFSSRCKTFDDYDREGSTWNETCLVRSEGCFQNAYNYSSCISYSDRCKKFDTESCSVYGDCIEYDNKEIPVYESIPTVMVENDILFALYHSTMLADVVVRLSPPGIPNQFKSSIEQVEIPIGADQPIPNELLHYSSSSGGSSEFEIADFFGGLFESSCIDNEEKFAYFVFNYERSAGNYFSGHLFDRTRYARTHPHPSIVRVNLDDFKVDSVLRLDLYQEPCTMICGSKAEDNENERWLWLGTRNGDLLSLKSNEGMNGIGALSLHDTFSFNYTLCTACEVKDTTNLDKDYSSTSFVFAGVRLDELKNIRIAQSEEMHTNPKSGLEGAILVIQDSTKSNEALADRLLYKSMTINQVISLGDGLNSRQLVIKGEDFAEATCVADQDRLIISTSPEDGRLSTLIELKMDAFSSENNRITRESLNSGLNMHYYDPDVTLIGPNKPQQPDIPIRSLTSSVFDLQYNRAFFVSSASLTDNPCADWKYDGDSLDSFQLCNPLSHNSHFHTDFNGIVTVSPGLRIDSVTPNHIPSLTHSTLTIIGSGFISSPQLSVRLKKSCASSWASNQACTESTLSTVTGDSVTYISPTKLTFVTPTLQLDIGLFFVEVSRDGVLFTATGDFSAVRVSLYLNPTVFGVDPILSQVNTSDTFTLSGCGINKISGVNAR